MTKICSRCQEEKPVADFGKNRSRHDGLTHYCRLCHRAALKEQRSGARPSPKPRPAPKSIREYKRKFHARRSNFRSTLRCKYGMTVADFDRLLLAQTGRCAGCSTPMTRPHVDHDHRTGVVRGLLCHWCNTAVGHAYDSPDVLRRLAVYLESADTHRIGATG